MNLKIKNPYVKKIELENLNGLTEEDYNITSLYNDIHADYNKVLNSAVSDRYYLLACENNNGMEDYNYYYELNIRNLNEISIFSIDFYEIDLNRNKISKYFYPIGQETFMTAYLYGEDKVNNINFKDYNLSDVYNIFPNETRSVKMRLSNRDYDLLLDKNTAKISKYFGMKIKTSNQYTYNQIVHLSFTLEANNDYGDLLLNILDYDTSIILGKASNRKIKLIIKKMIKNKRK